MQGRALHQKFVPFYMAEELYENCNAPKNYTFRQFISKIVSLEAGGVFFYSKVAFLVLFITQT